MRGVLGLVGITAVLVALVLAMRFSLDHTNIHPPIHNASSLDLTGRNNLGAQKAQYSATFVPVESDGEFSGLQVLSVVRGGIADRHFGLLAGDIIVGIGPFEMGDSTLPDFDAAREWVSEAYIRQNLPLVIERNGEQLTLPIGGAGDPSSVVASGGADGSNSPVDKSPQLTNPGGDE